MSHECTKCGRINELGCDESHDCVEYLKGVIAEIEARHEQELDDARQDSKNAYRRAYEANQETQRAHAQARQADEHRALERAMDRRREQKAQEDRDWARLTGRRI